MKCLDPVSFEPPICFFHGFMSRVQHKPLPPHLSNQPTQRRVRAVQMQLPGVTPAVAPSMKRGARLLSQKSTNKNLYVLMGSKQEVGGGTKQIFSQKKMYHEKQIQQQVVWYHQEFSKVDVEFWIQLVNGNSSRSHKTELLRASYRTSWNCHGTVVSGSIYDTWKNTLPKNWPGT